MMITLNYQQVRDEYMNVMNEHIELETDSTKAKPELVMDLLGLGQWVLAQQRVWQCAG